MLLATALLVPAPALGQAEPAAPEPGADLTVYLVTVGPGEAVWERFGHNLLWVRGGMTPVDSVWDWGRFSFDTEKFFVRFAQADMRYWMAGAPGPPWVGWYASTGRSVRLQELALSPPQRLALLEFLRWNDDEAHRYYQYHYYLDNCSTRIRDALDRVIGGALKARTDTVLTPWTFRDHTTRLNQHNPLLYFGLTTLLAGWTDRRITAWEEMFLPSGLERWSREVLVPGAHGMPTSLVAREDTLAAGGRFDAPDTPDRWWPRFLALGVFVGGLLALTGLSTRSRWRAAFLPLAVAYLAVAGLLGLAMALLWGLSGHEVAWRNENLWQFNLACLALLAVLPQARRGVARFRRAAAVLALVLLASSVLGLALKALPMFDQYNWDVIALVLPIHLGLAAGVLGLGAAARTQAG